MKENINPDASAKNDAEAKPGKTELAETDAKNDEKEFLIPVKVGEEIKQLHIDEVNCLAEKSRKFDIICEDYKALKQLAHKNSKSVPEFLLILSQKQNSEIKNELLDKCGGNEELADHILELENSAGSADEMGFSEFKEQFPQFSEISELPEQVVESARLKGTLLLDEYLRYELYCKKIAEQALTHQKNATISSVGSQADRRYSLNPEASEFLKGLWK